MTVSNVASRAADAVVPSVVVDDLRALVRIPSVTGSEEAVSDRLVELLGLIPGVASGSMHHDPAAIRADPDWPGAEMPRTTLPIVVGRYGRPGGRRIVLVGHTDVVPPGDPGSWTVDPWAGEIRDGQLYGRGACDMKGGVAAILGALRAVAETTPADRLSGEVLVAFVPSEEDGGQGMLQAIRSGVTGAMAVITEPSNLDVVVAHAGALTFRLTVRGRAAHASQRREGISALDNLWVLGRALEADEARRNEQETDPLMTALGLPYPTILGIVHGGDWASTVIDRIVADGRYGVRLGQSPLDAEQELRACIATACAADPFMRDQPAMVEIVGGRYGSTRVPSDHPLPVGLARATEAVTGRPPELLGEPYGSDMRLLVDQGATPTVIFGPGDVRMAHSADERVPLAEVEACARVLAAWVVDELG